MMPERRQSKASFSERYDASRKTSKPTSNASASKPGSTSRTVPYAKLFAAILIALAIVVIPFAVQDSGNDAAIPDDGSVGSRFVHEYLEYEVVVAYDDGNQGIKPEVSIRGVSITADELEAIGGELTEITIYNTVSHDFGKGAGVVNYYVTQATGQSFDAAGDLLRFKLDAGNKSDYFHVDAEGVLFKIGGNGVTNDVEELVRYPLDKKIANSHYQIPEGTKTIGDSAFYHCMYIKTVDIPTSVDLIDVYAFSGSSIEKVEIKASDSSITIESNAFNRCMSLTDIIMPANANLQSAAFAGSVNLETVTIIGKPLDNKQISFGAALKNWTLPGLKTDSTDRKTIVIDTEEEIIIPKMLVTGDAKENMIVFGKNTKSVLLGDNIFYIGDDADVPVSSSDYSGATDEFAGMEFIVHDGKLKETSKVGVTLEIRDVKGAGLSGNVNINSQSSSDAVTIYKYSSIMFEAPGYLLSGNDEEYVFIRWEMWIGDVGDTRYDNPLEFDFLTDAVYVAVFAKVVSSDDGEISFGDEELGYGVTGVNITIDGDGKTVAERTVGIMDCDPDAMEITIEEWVESPWGVRFKITSVSPEAFDGAESLEKILVDDESTTFHSYDGVLFKMNGTNKVYELVRFPLGKVAHPYTMPNETVVIGNSAFYIAPVTEVVMSKNLTTIRNYAFENSTLERADLPASLVSIGRDGFKDCMELTTMTMHASLQTISLAAFTGSTNLTDVTILSEDRGLSNNMSDYLSRWTLNGMPDWQITNLTFDTTATIQLPTFIFESGMKNAVEITDRSTGVSPGGNKFYPSLESDKILTEVNGMTFTYFDERWVASYVREVTLNISAWAVDPDHTDQMILRPNVGGTVQIEADGRVGETSLNVLSPSMVTVTAEATSVGENTYVFMYWEVLTAGGWKPIVDAEGMSVGRVYEFLLEQKSGDDNQLEMRAIFGSLAKSDEDGYLLNNVFKFVDEEGHYSYGMVSDGGVAKLSILNVYDKDGTSANVQEMSVPGYATYQGVKFEVLTIHPYAFDGLPNLRTIEVEQENKYYSSRDGVLYRIQDGNPYYELFRCAEGATYTVFTVPNDVVVLADSAFYDCDKLITVIIGTGVKDIAMFAFENADGLESIIIPNNVETIGTQAFLGCTSLAKISLPATVRLGDGVFGEAPIRDVTITYDGDEPIVLSYNISSWRLSGMTAADNIFTTLTLDIKGEVTQEEVEGEDENGDPITEWVDVYTMTLPLMAVNWDGQIIFTDVTKGIDAGDNAFYPTSQSVERLTGASLAGLSFEFINSRWAAADVYSLSMSNDSSGLTIENNHGAVRDEKLIVILLADELYTVPPVGPDAVKVYVGGVEKKTGITYEVFTDADDNDIVKGRVTVPAEHITAAVVITANATPAKFTVNSDLDDNLTWNSTNKDDATYNENYVARVTVEKNFVVTYDKVTVTIGGEELDFGNWTFSFGGNVATVTIWGDNIKGDVLITMESTPAVYTISADTLDATSQTLNAPADGCTVQIGDGAKGSTATATLGAGTEVKLTATATDDYVFLNWVAGGKVVSTSAEYTMLVAGPLTYTAVFAEKGAEITDEYDDESILIYRILDAYKVSVRGFNLVSFNTRNIADIPSEIHFKDRAFDVVEVDANAFSAPIPNMNLTTVNIPASVVSIGDSAFKNANISSINVDPLNTKYRSENGILFEKGDAGDTLVQFPAKSALESYVITNGVIAIGYGAFFGSANLESVTIPSTVRTIGDDAFMDAARLSSIIIPADVSFVGTPFDGCTALTMVTITGSTLSGGVNDAALIWKLPGMDGAYNTLIVDASGPMTLPALSGAGKAIRFSAGSTYAISGIDFYDNKDSLSPLDSDALAGRSFTYDVGGEKWIGAATYVIYVSGDNISRLDGTDNAVDGVTKSITISADEHYDLPLTIEVSVAGIGKLTLGSGYSYDPETGIVVIDGDKVKGAISIKGDATIKVYDVNFIGDHAIWTNPENDTASNGTPVTVTFMVDLGYNFPADVTVKIQTKDGLKIGVINVDYEYNGAGILTIFGASVLGDVTVEVIASPDAYSVTFSVTDVDRLDNNSEAIRGTQFETKFAANEHFDLPVSIVVMRGSDAMNPLGYTYVIDGVTGIATVTILAAYITMDMEIVGAATDILYKVTVTSEPADAGTVEGDGSYVYGETVTLTASPNDGYEFDSWTFNGNTVKDNPYVFNATDSDVTYTANFKRSVVDVMVDIIVDGDGIDTEELLKAIDDTAEGGGVNIIMDVTEMYVLPKDVFSDGRIVNKVLMVTVMDGDDIVSVWTFETPDTADDLWDPTKEANLDLEITQSVYSEDSEDTIDVIVGERIKEDGKLSDAIYLDLSASGVFGATVRYFVGMEHAGEKFTMYYFDDEDPENAVLVDQGQNNVIVDSEGYATFTITHASVYVFITNEDAPVPQPPEDLTMIYIMVVIVVIGIIVMLILVARMPEKE